MSKKESFILYASYREVISQLSDMSAGILFKALLVYQTTGEEIEMPIEVKIAFGFIKNQMRIDKEKYNKFCEKQVENGKKGGRPKKPDGFSENPKNPSLFSETQEKLNENENENENEKGNDNENEKGKESIPPHNPPKGKKESKGKSPPFIPPSVKEVSAYCLERQNNIDAEHFHSYYLARGWIYKGGTKMKDWRAAVRTWEAKRKEEINSKVNWGP